MANPRATEAIGSDKPYSREEFTRWLTESCERQHVAITITNPTVLSAIAVLLQ